MARRYEIIANAKVQKKHKFAMPEKVSLMSFATRRRQVEKTVKEEEYKTGSKATDVA